MRSGYAFRSQATLWSVLPLSATQRSTSSGVLVTTEGRYVCR